MLYLGWQSLTHIRSSSCCARQLPRASYAVVYKWLTDSMARLRQATPGPTLESLLPPSASSFFSFYANAASTLTASLQSSITDLANNRNREACRDAAKQLRQQDGGRALVHFTACCADLASAWKRAAPTQPLTTLLDKQYRIASRLNLGLLRSAATTSCRLTAHCATRDRVLWRTTHGTTSAVLRSPGGRATRVTTPSRTRFTARCC